MAVRKRYLRFLGPAMGVLVLLAFLLLWISGFGFRYLFKKPVPLASLSEPLPGTYVTLPVEDVTDTFAVYGYAGDDGQPVVRERYCLWVRDGKYLILRLTKPYAALLEQYENRSELVLSGKIASVRELDFGELKGTLNRVPNSTDKQLREWITAHQLSASALTDRLTGADLSAYAGAEAGDYGAYLEAVILPVELDTGCLGARSGGLVKALSVLALILCLGAIALAVTVFLGLWEKPTRAAVRQFGQNRLATDYNTAEVFGPQLIIGHDFLWAAGPLFTQVLELKEILWAYPRSRRQEGGSLRWRLVLKTERGEEAVVKLSSEAETEKAIACIQSRGFPLTVGFDKEKQKLYKKDLTAFRSKVVNGTI